MEFQDLISKLILIFIPFLFSLCFHEFAHAWTALKLGDETAKHMGRLSLNPMVHADPIGTFVLPISVIALGIPVFFGWAKPVPVNPRNLKNVKSDMFWIALAGPLSNVLLAFVGAFVFVYLFHYQKTWTYQPALVDMLQVFVPLNLALAIFNMIPIHPLDGGKVLARFLPYQLNQKLEENQMFLSMLLLLLFLGGFLALLRYPIFWSFQFLVGFAEMILI